MTNVAQALHQRRWQARAAQGVAQRREYRTEPEAREERTGLAGAGVALRWADRQANPPVPKAGYAAVAAVAW